MSKDNDDSSLVLQALVRGILIGASLGIVAGLFFMDGARALALGGICGAFAGLTHYKLREKREDRD